VRLLSLSDEGQKLLREIEPDLMKAQQRILQPLPAAERHEFMRMLRKLVTANNELSRAPTDASVSP
jgi:DNA-binding MarR family transcriptional regulator